MTAELAIDDFETLADRAAREFKPEGGSSGGGSGGGGGGAPGTPRSPSPAAAGVLGSLAGMRKLAPGWLHFAVGSSGGGGGGGGGGVPAATSASGAGAAAAGSPLASPGSALRRLRSSTTLGGGGGPDPLGSRRVTVTVECDLHAWTLLPVASVRILGSDGELAVDHFLRPHLYHALTVWSRSLGATWTQRCYGAHGASASEYLLEAFVDEVKYKVRCCPDRHDPTRAMLVVDNVYAAAGLPVRGGATDVPGLLARMESLTASIGTPPRSHLDALGAGDRPPSGLAAAAGGSGPAPARASAPFMRSRTRPELGRDLGLRPPAGATVSPPSPSSPGTTPPGSTAPLPVRPVLQRSTSVVN
jgi:hypothetical protein